MPHHTSEHEGSGDTFNDFMEKVKMLRRSEREKLNNSQYQGLGIPKRIAKCRDEGQKLRQKERIDTKSRCRPRHRPGLPCYHHQRCCTRDRSCLFEPVRVLSTHTGA
jgi:hypothetical protein